MAEEYYFEPKSYSIIGWKLSKKIGECPYTKYTQKMLYQKTEKLQKGKICKKEAAEKNRISWHILHYRFKDHHIRKPGFPTYLSSEEDASYKMWQLPVTLSFQWTHFIWCVLCKPIWTNKCAKLQHSRKTFLENADPGILAKAQVSIVSKIHQAAISIYTLQPYSDNCVSETPTWNYDEIYIFG
jgi:hypothetical protein